MKDWREARGCKIERQICEAYGVKILEYDFLDEFKETMPTYLFNGEGTPVFTPCEHKNPIPESPYKITCENEPIKITYKDYLDSKLVAENEKTEIPKGAMPY